MFLKELTTKINLRFKALIIAVVFGLMPSILVAQNTINFDDQGYTNAQDLNNFNLTSSGVQFDFTSTSTSNGYEYRTTSNFCSYTGGAVFYTGGTVTLATISTNNGSEFDFNSIRIINDFACFALDYTVTITGYKDGAAVTGATISQLIDNVSEIVDATGDSDFDDVDEIRITGSSNLDSHGFDDFVWSAAAAANAAPTDITLSSNSINQSATGVNATVGTLTTTDADAGDSHTYSLVSGPGDTNNGSFNISGNTLRTSSALTAGVYSVRINTNDGTDDFAEAFSITVVAPIELTIAGLTGDDKTYDGTTTASASGTASLSGVVGADDVSLGGSPAFTFATANVGTGITITTTGYTLSGTDAGKYTLTQPTLSADITARTLTITGITGDNKTYDGTTAGTASGTASLSGVVGADDVSIGGSPVFTFASANVGTGITVTTTGYTISGTESGNYTLTQPTLSADITTRALTVTGITGDDKVYDGTTAATASGTPSLSGVIGADDISLGGSPVFTYATANVGTGITITTTGYTISGTDAGNYTLTQPTLSADITTATLTITGITGDDKVYDGTTTATASGTPSLSGVIGADDVSLGGSPVFTFASANVGTGITITTTGYTISGTDAGNYSLTQPTLSADITAKSLTITGLTGNNKAYDGTTAATASGTPSLSGVVGADDVSLGGSPVFTFASPNAGTGITITTTGYTISGTDAGNYSLTQPTLSADITAIPLTITGIIGDNKSYDGTTAATASGTASLVGVVGADDVTLSGSPVFTFASANTGTGITITTSGYTLSGTDAGKYILTQPTLSADITARFLTITGITGDDKAYDGTTAATASGTPSLSGVIGADDVSIGGSPVFTFASANVGTGITVTTTGYTISGTESGNYTLTQPTLSADITTRALTVTGITGDDKVYDGTTAATASGTPSLSGVVGADDVSLGGSPVFTFASANAGTGITVTTTGYTISGTDAGNYSLTQPTLSADITAVLLTITGISVDDKVYDGTTAGTASGTASLSGVIGADDVSLGGSPVFTFATANVGTGITVTTTGYTISGTDAANYSLTQPTLSADITTATLTITGITGDDKVYDGTTAATASGTPSLSGVIGADDVSLGGSPVFTFATANVGTGITVTTTGYTISGTESGNYTLTQPTLSADITTATLTITGITGDDKVYDGTTVATASGTASLSGVIGADDVSLGGSPVFTYATANVGTGITVTTTGYTISGTDAGNYSLTQPTLSADITTATLSITGITGDDKVYDGTTAGTASGTASLSGVIGADDVSLGGSPVFTFATANVGTGITITTIGYTISGTESGNYSLTQPTLSADITTATLTITGITGDDKVYDGTTAATASGTPSLSGVIGADDVSLGGSPVFTFATANVGTGITVTTTGYTISGTESGNYTLTQPTLSADITTRALTVTGITGDDKVYDGTTAATASGTPSLSGVIGADDVSLGGSPVFTYATANVGTGITVTTTGYTISGTDAGNYSLTQPTLSADITTATLSITGITGDDKVYDGITAATASGTPSLSGVIGADDVSIGGSPVFTFASANVGTGITVTTTGYTISGTESGNYTLTQPTLSADITTRALTVTGITGDDKVYDGTTAATASGTPSLSGVIGADDVSLGGSPVFTYATANVGTGITVTTTGYTISGTDAGNYSLTQPTLSADITTATLSITGITGDDKVYDGTTAGTASGTASLSGVIGADDVSLGGSPVFTFATANVGTGITVTTTGYTISGTESGNYSLTQPTLSADITTATLTITGITGDDKVYDGTTTGTASGTASLSGVIGADDVSLGGSPVFTFATANVGTGITVTTTGYTISGTDAANYSLTQPTLSADITTATLTITGITGDDKVYDGTTVATASGTASLSGVIGADDVSLGGSPVFTFASANVGTGITVTTTGYTISGTESGNYSLTQPTLSADITTATLSITGITGDDKVYDGTTAATASGTPSLSGVIGADDVSLGGSPVFTFASVNVGTGITVTTTGYTISGTESGNYSLTQPTLSADITAATLTITGITGDDKVYDGTTAATASGTPSLSGVIGADDVSLGGSPVFTFTTANVGTGITITTTGYTISGTESGNYTLTQPTLSADITTATLTITGITGDDKVYDGTTTGTASGTASLSGVIGADDVSLGGSPVFTFASANAGTGITVTTTGYTISGTDAGNYSLTQPTLSADITTASLTITGITGDDKVYDGTTAATASGTASLSGLIGADDVSLGGSPVFTFATANVGTAITITTSGYTISGTDAANYSLTQPTLSANITPPVVGFVATSSNGLESVSSANLTLNLSTAFTSSITIDYAVGGTATGGGVDYTLASGTITLNAGSVSEDIIIAGIVDDAILEANETVIVTLSNPVNAVLNANVSHTYTIINNDVAAVTITNVSGNEDDGDITVSATLDNAVQGGFTLEVNTADGTATVADSDYTTLSGELLTFSGTAGETQTFTITPTVDSKVESNETLVVSMANLGATALGVVITDNATVTITNDDTAGVLIADVSGNEDDGSITVTAMLNNAVQGGFTIDVSSADGTATIGDSDYSAVTAQTLTFAGTAGETQTFTITPTADNKLETDETVTISQSNLAATTLAVTITNTATVTITNDDFAVVTIADATANEDDGNITLTASLSNPVDGGFTVAVSTADGTATTADSDYTAITGQTLTFAGMAGETQTFTVSPTVDGKVETDENITVSMGSVGGTTFTIDVSDDATVTFTNDDETPVVTASQSFTIDENLADATSIGTLLATDTDAGTTFQGWTIVSGNTDVDSDMNGPFAINAATGEITVNDSGDLNFESGTTSFTLVVTVSDGDNISAQEDVTITINDVNDVAPIVTAGQNFSIDENLAIMTSVGTLSATDSDVTATTFSAWMITAGNDLGIFAIDASNGEITIADNSDLDRENIANVTLSITVSDGVNTSVAETVTINVNDLNDELPVITAGQTFSVNENAANDFSLGNAVATDIDITATTFSGWTIISGNDDGLFAIDQASGEITVADNSTLDFEATASYTLVLTVTDEVNTSAQENVTITVLDENEVPEIAGLMNLTTDEDVTGTTGFTVTDPDTNLDDLTFTFAVDNTNVFETTDVSVTGTGADRILTVSPNANQFGTTSLTVTISDGVLSSEATIDVIVNPVNDIPVSLSLSNQTIEEDVAIGFEVGTFTTEDIDVADTHSYSLVSGDDDTDNAIFTINGDALELAEMVDFEDGDTRTIRVRTTDSAGDFIEESFTITLNANPDLELVIKTAFTPDGDGVNDTWIIDNITLHPKARVSIINREGNSVFESTGYQTPWDGTFNGKELPVDTYYYVIDLETGGRRYEGFVMILK